MSIEKSDISQSPVPSTSKDKGTGDLFQIEDAHHLSQKERIQQVDAIAEDVNVGPETFAHLDINKILRKIDMRLIPMLTLLYLLSFLDRGNIGNANIEGLSDDLKLTGPQYNWCLTAFFFTYCAFEVPSNMALKRTRPSIWLPAIMVAWGTVMTLMGLVQDYKGLIIARIFLGIAEAGLFPGVAFYITMWYTRYQVQVRQAYFFSAASAAGAFSGLLAYGISFMDGVGNLAGWRWIFILEGIVTVLVAILAFFVLVDYPETATFLTVEERAFITWRLKYDSQGSSTTTNLDARKTSTSTSMTLSSLPRIPEASDNSRHYVIAAFRDWQIWVNVLCYWGYIAPLYGVSLFLPTIIKELGYQTTTAQLLTVPIYVTASIITIVVAHVADHKRIRYPFIFVGLIFQAIGFLMCLVTTSPGVTYAGVFIAACAIYQCQPTNITWLSNNLSGSYKRAVGMGIQISVGNLSGAMASNFYRSSDSPRYRLGHGLELGFIIAGFIALNIQVLMYKKINRDRDRKFATIVTGIGAESTASTGTGTGGDGQLTASNGNNAERGVDSLLDKLGGIEELSRRGDKAITFRYTL